MVRMKGWRCGDTSSDRLSFRHLAHLFRQVGSVHAHIGMGGSITLRPDKEIAQLSIRTTCAFVHFGHVGLGMFLVRPSYLGTATLLMYASALKTQADRLCNLLQEPVVLSFRR